MIGSTLWVLAGLACALLFLAAAVETAITLYHTFEPIFRMVGS